MNWTKYSYVDCEECVCERDSKDCKDILKSDGLTQDEDGCGRIRLEGGVE